MRKCCQCGTMFDVDYARDSYNLHFDGGLDYDEEFPDNDTCEDCAIAETESYIQAGIDAVGPGFEWD